MLWSILKAVRPHQWVKNLFVAAPVVFAKRLGDPSSALRAAAAFGAFCLLTSAVYLVNDLVDLEKDRAHPVKRHRPIASGKLKPELARALAGLFAVAAVGSGLALGWPFAITAFSYLALNAAYSLRLKRIAFVDVACISVGFLLRVLAGALAVGVPASRWLLVCTLLLSSLLGFGKRAHELRIGGEGGHKHREVLGDYDPRVLRLLLGVLGVITPVAYLMYTRTSTAMELGNGRLVFTVPFAVFGIYRFIRIVSRTDTADSPTDLMLHDPAFVVNLLLYAGAVAFIVIAAP
ncbi:MAG TPA: decaprenyl-phosphate phosphoribosyltransferase [Polyangia bacterium]|nr:decaprenyl-phosphate phosphoribosyltransferase [Polyangia bacterium]